MDQGAPVEWTGNVQVSLKVSLQHSRSYCGPMVKVLASHPELLKTAGLQHSTESAMFAHNGCDENYDGSVCDGHEHYDDADHLTHFLWTCNWILKVHLEQQFFSLST